MIFSKILKKIWKFLKKFKEKQLKIKMSTEEIVDDDGYNVVPEDEPVNIFIF